MSVNNPNVTAERTLSIQLPERVVVFLDYAKTEAAAANHRVDLDLGQLLDDLVAGRQLVEAHCYMPIDPRRRCSGNL